jgi:hypothetical protein
LTDVGIINRKNLNATEGMPGEEEEDIEEDDGAL